MELIINGEKITTKDNIILLDLLKEKNLEGKVMAAAVNMDIVKQVDWDSFKLKDGDKLELLDFVGGG